MLAGQAVSIDELNIGDDKQLALDEAINSDGDWHGMGI
jgi:hypothetical protein